MNKNESRDANKRVREPDGEKRSRLVKITLLLVVIIAMTMLTSVAYGMAYSESQGAVNGLTVYCENAIRVPHPPSPDHPFSHFIVTFGIKNPSSTDVNAHWLVSASDPSQNYYNIDNDASFVIPRRDVSRPQFSFFIGAANITVPPPSFAITATYKVSLFSFQQSLPITNALPGC